LPRYQADEREIAVRLWIREEDRETLNQLKNLTFETEAEEEVALSTFAEFKVSKGRGTIYRKDGKTQLRIRAFSTRKDRRVLYANVDRAMDGFSLPRGYSWDKGERFARLKASDQALYLAIGLSVVFVFLLMGILFESFILPFSVLLSIPFALLGVYWTLYLTETTLNGMAQVGAILLVGVVVNNAIVLVDRINRLRLDGWDRDGAVVEAGFNRFRPILMTTFTTVFGLLPMAVGGSTLLGVSYVPLGRTMMGGLIFSTFLTLYIVPIFYTFLDDLGDAVRRMIGAAWDSGR
jgi:HAE1 family hydrophobic/amphiphilic exporter-1